MTEFCPKYLRETNSWLLFTSWEGRLNLKPHRILSCDPLIWLLIYVVALASFSKYSQWHSHQQTYQGLPVMYKVYDIAYINRDMSLIKNDKNCWKYGFLQYEVIKHAKINQYILY